MASNMSERLKAAQAKTKSNQGASKASVETTFKTVDDVPKKETRKFTFNIDLELYQKLRREAFEAETDMTSLINSYLKKAMK